MYLIELPTSEKIFHKPKDLRSMAYLCVENSSKAIVGSPLYTVDIFGLLF